MHNVVKSLIEGYKWVKNAHINVACKLPKTFLTTVHLFFRLAARGWGGGIIRKLRVLLVKHWIVHLCTTSFQICTYLKAQGDINLYYDYTSRFWIDPEIGIDSWFFPTKLARIRTDFWIELVDLW